MNYLTNQRGNRVMMKLACAVVISISAVSIANAEESGEFKHFSLSANVVPTLQNSTDTSVPGENKINDTAFQYQFNYINQPTDYKAGPVNQKLDYVSLRKFAYKHAYTDPDSTGTAADGVGSIDGIALLYGQRYLLSETGYQGFGLGWYAGYAMITDTWVQKCCGPIPTVEKKGIPVAAAEIFYKINVIPNFYIEPGVTFAYESKGSGPVNTIPAIIVGGEF